MTRRVASLLAAVLTTGVVVLGTAGPSSAAQVPTERQCYSCWN